MTTKVLRTAIFLIAAFWHGVPAEACDCAILPTCATLWDADLVFVGTTTRVSGDRNLESAEFTVDERLRGEPSGEPLTLVSEHLGFSCDYDFDEGVRYLVFARKGPDGVWKASLCGGAVPFPPASSMLKDILETLQSRATGTVSGQVTFDAFPDERVGGGPPIPDATVTLQAGQRVLTTTTNAIGVYRFDRVPPDEYTLAVRLPPNATPVSPIRVRVGPQACLTRHVFPEPR
jgi:hypothetical protein